MTIRESFYDVLTAAVADIAEHGYGHAAQIEQWQQRLEAAAFRMLGPFGQVEAMMRDAMTAIYKRLIERGGYVKYHPGLPRFTVERIRPSLRAELDRAIWTNVNLIKLNREQAMAETTRRFTGWASSIPAGGAADADKREIKAEIKKPLAQQPFIARRVAIDQGHKLVSAINATIAKGGDAIAGIWHDHGEHDKRYDARKEHLARSGKVFLVRDSWAHKAGLVKPGDVGYVDEIDAPGEKVFCRCYFQYIYALRSLPANMRTEKGNHALAEAREKIGAMA